LPIWCLCIVVVQANFKHFNVLDQSMPSMPMSM
jgi:hypothetical protein